MKVYKIPAETGYRVMRLRKREGHCLREAAEIQVWS